MVDISNNFSSQLKSYFDNKFLLHEKTKEPFSEEDSVAYWENYLENSSEKGFEIIRKFYPQLYFPIEEGINKSPDYISTVLRGKSVTDLKSFLNINNPENITVKIYKSFSGKIPVIIIPDEQDFRTVIRSLLHKNNPVDIPLSMGAALVNGINNWGRINHLKDEWLVNNPFGNWSSEFSLNILPNSDLYKDKIIILSKKPYSNVSAEKLGISAEEWDLLSLSIRLEHECTHLYTLKKYGTASNNLHDELIADYVGTAKSYGSYNKTWMLQFMGLEEYPKYRKGSRLENYFPKSELSERDFEKLITHIKNSIENISIFDNELGKIKSVEDKLCRIQSLCETSLIELGSKNGSDLIIKKYKEIVFLRDNSL